MNLSRLAALLSAILFATTATPQTAPNPTGVWVGMLDGQVGTTLTLANDGGELGGTIVFNAVNGDHQIMEIQPHVLLHPKLTGNTLKFQVKMERVASGFYDLEVVFTSGLKATLRCTKCSSDSPVETELDKSLAN